jgi:acyl-CoA dehydrogenase
MDLTPRPDVQDLVRRTRAFVDDVVVPVEGGLGQHGPDEALRAQLQRAARAAGLFAPHMPPEVGGLGLDMRSQALVFETAGRSLLGPLALNCAAPDEGNMALLEKIADGPQRARYLAPLAAGEVRSCFAMTERPPGAGSDPSMLVTTARPVPGGWRIDGEKWFITGAAGAAFAIVMARTGDDGATMFLVDAGTPGMTIAEVIDTIDRASPGGHARVTFDGCVVPGEAVLGEVGKGFAYAQLRLAPARLTHCMRWTGLAARALDLALDRANARELFGSRLTELGLAQGLIADSVIDLEASRALIQRTAALLDRGEDGRFASSVAKTFCSEAAYRVVDRAIQLSGSAGIETDPLGRYLAEIRPFRIYDGANETHRWSIARRTARARAAAGQR